MFGLWLIVALISLHNAHRLIRLETQMTKAIEDFNAAMSAFFDRQDLALSDLRDDVVSLADQIAALVASAGNAGSPLSASDQALLDALASRASAIATKLDALDAMTPPLAQPPATGP